MTEEKLKELEFRLLNEGYKKYNIKLSSSEDYGWFKSIYEDEDENKLRTMIEYRVWDWSKYQNTTQEPYGVDILILDGDSSYRIDLNITSPKFNIETTELIAEDLHKMLKPYIEKGGII